MKTGNNNCGDSRRQECGPDGLCPDVRDVLFDYLSGELGGARSELVREHLRRCADCRSAAAELSDAAMLLKRASQRQAGVPEMLSDERKRRIRRAAEHPAMQWVVRRHVLVSLIAAVLAAAVVFLVLRRARMYREQEWDGIGIEIGVGYPPTSREAPAEHEETPLQ
ncbi:MAG: hypothetical protein FJ224_01480 [Lentisphaerae bacterium]|nr:hypothetical protein [Lentisphaerota bacterium]